MPTGRRRSTLLVSLLAATAALAGGAVPALAGGPREPSVKLIAPDSTPTIQRYRGNPAYLDAGVLLGATRGDFAIYAFRRDYDHEVEVWQRIGTTMKRLPDDVADGLKGLDRFLRVQLWDRDGELVLDKKRDFCPSAEDVRFSAAGPLEATYPRTCWPGPFMLGTVWGIDQGWALDPFGWDAPRFNGPNGRYTMRVSIAPRYRQLFGISAADASKTLQIRIKTGEGCKFECPVPREEQRPDGHALPGSIDQSFDAPRRGTLGRAPTVQTPPAGTLPDLRALPAFYVNLSQNGSRERISFAATVWNAGPAPMLVEGFRRDGDYMDAFQYFMRDGESVGRARVGRMEYHGGNHNHWHFLQFARYSLWDASMERIVVSKKQAFCLVPTDAIDLTVDGADWRPGDDGLGTACGSYDPRATWMRETLQAGWGDTYYQVGGTSLEVTGLPNGVYYLAVEANPDGLLYETDSTNNVELRKIRLGGSPGARTIRVFDFHGINV